MNNRLYHPYDMYSGKRYPVINEVATMPFICMSLPACYPQHGMLYYPPEMSQMYQPDIVNAASEYQLQQDCESVYDGKNNDSSMYYYNDHRLSTVSDDLATAPSSPGDHRLSHSSSSSSIASSPFSSDCCFMNSPLVYQQQSVSTAYSNCSECCGTMGSIGCHQQQATQHVAEMVAADQVMYHPPHYPSVVSSPPPSTPSQRSATEDVRQNNMNGDKICDLRPYLCYICPRAFARKHDLQRHIRVHTGDKPYACISCKKAFARTDALKRHLRMEESCRMSPEVQAMKCAGKRRYRNL